MKIFLLGLLGVLTAPLWLPPLLLWSLGWATYSHIMGTGNWIEDLRRRGR